MDVRVRDLIQQRDVWYKSAMPKTRVYHFGGGEAV